MNSNPVKSTSEQMQTALSSFNETLQLEAVLQPEILQPREDISEVANESLVTSEGQEES